jgi:hypothetical protein
LANNKPLNLTGWAKEYYDNYQKFGNNPSLTDIKGNTSALSDLTNMTYGTSGLGLSDYSRITGADPNAKSDIYGNVVNPNSIYGERSEIPSMPATPDYGDLPEGMSYSEALARSQRRLNPQYDAMRGKLEQTYSQQREQIPQLLAARYGGISGTRGGRRQAAEYGTTQQESQAISETEASRQAAIEMLAEAIQSEDYNKQLQAWQLAQNQKQQQYANAMEQYRLALDKQQREKDQNLQLWLQMQGWSREDARSAVEQQRWEQQFDWDKQKHQGSPEAQPWYLDLYKQGLEADIKNTLRSANAPYGGGGGGSGGSGGGSGSTSINQRATQQAISQVWSYNSPEEAVTAYSYYGPSMATQGVDLSKVWTEMQKRWPNYKAFNQEEEW